MPKATTTCDKILALIFNAVAWANMADNAASSPFTNLYLSLHTADPGVGGSQLTNEAAYTNYVRVAVARTTSGWAVPSGGETSNAALVQFAQCGVTGATITHVAIGTASADIVGKLEAAADLAGSGDLEGALGALADLAASLEGAGAVSAAAVAKAFMSANIVVTGDLLTAETVAQSVWAAAASASNSAGSMGEKLNDAGRTNITAGLIIPCAGSMGEKLNDAGSASNPWTEVIESGYTAAEIMRLLAAVMAGKSNGGGGTTINFRDLADTKDRITATVDTNGNRSTVVKDAT